jgi:hypothetical protein
VSTLHLIERQLHVKKLRPRIEKACRGRRCGRLSKRTEQQLGGGVLLFPQATLGGGVGRPNHEALREEVHRFVENEYIRYLFIF